MKPNEGSFVAGCKIASDGIDPDQHINRLAI